MGMAMARSDVGRRFSETVANNHLWTDSSHPLIRIPH